MPATSPAYSAVPVTPKQRHRLRVAELDQEYQSDWRNHHEELVEFLAPRAGRFEVATDTNKGQRVFSHLLNMRATEAIQVGVSGLLAGTSSPSRPWFSLGLRDKKLAKFGPVREWLYDVRELMLAVFARSNTYGGFSHCYDQVLSFGTAVDLVFPDFENVVLHSPESVGAYRLATSHDGKVQTMARRFSLTVAQMVERFGLERCSQTVKNAWDNGRLNQRHTVVHLIEPRSHFKTGRAARNDQMKIGSWYWEESQQGKEDYLLETGMRRMRVLAPRWRVYPGDSYGEGPGMWALGHVKALQHKTLRKGEAIDYQTKPPLTAPASMQGMELDLLPGGISYHTGLSSDGIKEMFQARVNLADLSADILKDEQMIDALFFRDLFMLVTNSERAMTAYEVAKRYEEKLLVLGPVLDRLHSELHAPMIDMAFEDLLAAGALPPIPEELEGVELSVEFISPLAQAQKLVGMQAIERLLGLTFQIAAGGKADALDVIDTDVVLEDAVEVLGTNPKYLVPPEVRQARRDAREQAAAQQQQAETMATVAGAAADASSAQAGNELSQFTALGP